MGRQTIEYWMEQFRPLYKEFEDAVSRDDEKTIKENCEKQERLYMRMYDELPEDEMTLMCIILDNMEV